MKIKSNSWMVWLICSTFGYDWYDKERLPKTLCSFFWMFIISLIIAPLAIHSHIFNFVRFLTKKWNDEKPCHAFYGMVFLLIGSALATGPISTFLGEDIKNFSILHRIEIMYFSSFLGIILAVSIIAVGLLVIFLILFIGEKIIKAIKKRNSGKEYKGAVLSVAAEFIKAKKQKVCPIIEYVDNGKNQTKDSEES